MRLVCALGSFVASVAAAAPYAIWAHSHMVWLSGGATQAEVEALLAAYAARNISVGAVNIDSSWSTGYNNFDVDTAQWPDLPGFVAARHAASQRVLLWMTSMVNTDSSNYAEALAQGFFVRDGTGVQASNLSWWHGRGGLVDFSNPKATQWWNAQLDNVLDLGIDGFKCDGAEPYMLELITPRGINGPITMSEYQDGYYGGAFNHSRLRNSEALIWSRPVDSYPIAFNLSAYLTFSPKYVLFSGWVGDQDPTFAGLKDAMVNIFESAWQNYTNFASDTAGYRSGRRTADLFLRWAQINAFLPLFENGGDDDHTPWQFDTAPSTEVTDAYRRLVAAHSELAPYFLATGSAAYAAGVSSIAPTADPPADFPFIVEPDQVSVWSFALGPSVFVAPIVTANATTVAVQLPAAGVSFYEFWRPDATHAAGSKFDYASPLPYTGAPSLPNAVFVRSGALLPLHVSTGLALLPQGHTLWAAALTLLVQDLGSSAALTGAAAAALGFESLSVRRTGSSSLSLLLSASQAERPVIFVWRRSPAGANAEACDANALPAAASYSLSASSKISLRLRAPEPRRPAGETPAVLAFDATAATAPANSSLTLHRDAHALQLHDSYAAELAGSFSVSSCELVAYLPVGVRSLEVSGWLPLCY